MICKKVLSIISKKILMPIYIRHVKKVCSIDERLIVFMSRPDFSDNALALFEYLRNHSEYSKYRLIWAISGEKNAENNVKTIRLYGKNGLISYHSLKVMMCAKYLFSTHDFIFPKSQSMPGQIYIMLWHGCGYKDKPSKTTSHDFDWACVPGPLFVKTKAKSWNVPEAKFIAKGYPRYDWMLQKSKLAQQMAMKIKGSSEIKLVMWMPTFRNSIVNKNVQENAITQFPLMEDENAWNRLEIYCEKIGVKLLIKLHAVQKTYDIDFSKFKNISLVSTADFEQFGIQMYQFLPFSDALISDYSSIAVDYLVLDKPVAFALDDFELYKRLRGFVFDDPRVYMPGHHMYTENDLYDFLKDVADGRDLYEAERKKMVDQALCISESYCKNIVDCLKL